MLSLLKNGKTVLIMALLSLLAIYLLGWAWIGIILYLIDFAVSILVLVQEYKAKGVGIDAFITSKLKDVFSKDIFEKGSHVIVICLVPLALYLFYCDIVVDQAVKSLNQLQDSFSDLLDY